MYFIFDVCQDLRYAFFKHLLLHKAYREAHHLLACHQHGFDFLNIYML